MGSKGAVVPPGALWEVSATELFRSTVATAYRVHAACGALAGMAGLVADF